MHIKQVLIVEDDLVSANYLKSVLESENFQVVAIVNSAENAITYCQENRADIILMDIILKGKMSGIEAAIRIKQHKPQCQIIFLTAYVDDEMINAALESKAYAYLMKPYRENEIVTTMKMALSREKERDFVPLSETITLKNGYVYHMKLQLLTRHGEVVALSAQKNRLIALLAKNRNIPIPIEQISEHLWNDSQKNSSVRSLVKRLRANIGDDLIVNIKNIGYMIS